MGRHAMTKQQIKVRNYWEVIVYYNMDYASFHHIHEDLRKIGASNKTIASIHYNMASERAKAVTLSNEDKHVSIVLFNKHQSRIDYINSMVHEAEHVKQAMLRAYDIEDEGEDPAYTIGYLVSRMWRVFRHI